MRIETDAGAFEVLASLPDEEAGEVLLVRQHDGSLATFTWLSPMRASVESERARFVEAARRAARASSRLVLVPSAFGVHEDRPFVVHPYRHGVSLRKMLAGLHASGRRLPPHVATAMILAVVGALDEVHDTPDERGEPLQLVHGAITTDRVLVSFLGGIELGGIGIARSLGLTGPGDLAVVDARRYAAPEIMLGDEFDTRADVYSLAAVLWEAIAMRRFQRDLADKPLSSLVSDAPAALDAVMLQALDEDADRRQPSLDEFRHSLSSAVPIASRVRLDRLGVLAGTVVSPELARGRATFPQDVIATFDRERPAMDASIVEELTEELLPGTPTDFAEERSRWLRPSGRPATPASSADAPRPVRDVAPSAMTPRPTDARVNVEPSDNDAGAKAPSPQAPTGANTRAAPGAPPPRKSVPPPRAKTAAAATGGPWSKSGAQVPAGAPARAVPPKAGAVPAKAGAVPAKAAAVPAKAAPVSADAGAAAEKAGVAVGGGIAASSTSAGTRIGGAVPAKAPARAPLAGPKTSGSPLTPGAGIAGAKKAPSAAATTPVAVVMAEAVVAVRPAAAQSADASVRADGPEPAAPAAAPTPKPAGAVSRLKHGTMMGMAAPDLAAPRVPSVPPPPPGAANVASVPPPPPSSLFSGGSFPPPPPSFGTAGASNPPLPDAFVKPVSIPPAARVPAEAVALDSLIDSELGAAVAPSGDRPILLAAPVSLPPKARPVEATVPLAKASSGRSVGPIAAGLVFVLGVAAAGAGVKHYLDTQRANAEAAQAAQAAFAAAEPTQQPVAVAAVAPDLGVADAADAGFDAGLDAGEDAGFDAGEDAGFDVGVDAGEPEALQAAVPPDDSALAADSTSMRTSSRSSTSSRTRTTDGSRTSSSSTPPPDTSARTASSTSSSSSGSTSSTSSTRTTSTAPAVREEDLSFRERRRLRRERRREED